MVDEAQLLHQSTLMVDDLITNGSGSLTALVEQRQMMRGVRNVVMRMENVMGLTNSTMRRIIERRDITDAYLVLAGIIVTCIFPFRLNRYELIRKDE